MKTRIISIISLFTFIELNAQNDQNKGEGVQDADALAKKLADPNATVGVLFNQFDYVRYPGDIDNAGQNGIIYNFQPSLPVPLSSSVNLFVRTLIPVYLSQPVLGQDGFSNSASLGNISADVAVGKTWPSKWMTMIGVFGAFPTATNKELKSNFTTLGPEIVPDGTYFGWLDCRSVGLTHKDLEHFAVHKLKLAVLDGSQFGENGTGFLRLNLGTQRSRVETAMERIAMAAR